jgi:glycosyltransferase involved in cell wall biosynthesis
MLSVVVPCREISRELIDRAASYTWADEVVLQMGPGGAALARNNGARRASGDVLVFSDDDTVLEWREPWTPKPEELYWVASEFVSEVADEHTTSSCAMMTALTLPVKRLRWLCSVGPFIACRRAVFDALGGFRFHAIEDVDFGQRATRLGIRVERAPVVARVTRPFRFRSPQDAIAWWVEQPDPVEQDGPAVVLTPGASARPK